MQRFAYRFSIAAGSEDRYRAAHDTMAPALRRLYSEAGLRNYTLFLDGTDVFAFLESERDPAAVLAAVGADPLEIEFNRGLEGVIVDLDAAAPAPMQEVWHLD